MAIVTYKCDVCKREIELQRNIHGLETPQRCIITHGCRGKLIHKEIFPDFIRGSTPDDVIGLDNWQQRKVLFDYEQAIERDQWTIEHNLGNSVNVSAFVNQPTEDDPENLVEIEPDDIIVISADIIKLIFSRPYSGKAQLVARASDPQLLQPKITEEDESVTSHQISSTAEISIATLVTNQDINLEVTYRTPQETTVVTTYVLDDQPSLLSPWVSVNQVVIKGKLYLVRSFNALFNDIPTIVGNGSTFRFTAIDDNNNLTYRPIEKGEAFLLLASDPFTAVDKITDQVIDVTDVTEDVNPFSFAYDSGEFFSTSNPLQTIYPPVREA